ncbi:MAG: DUF2110 family protein [Candidatus Helarchaeota archaeon]
MRTITLLEKTYGSYKIAALNAFKTRLTKELEGLQVELKRVYNNSANWITVELEGADEDAAFNFLNHKLGSTSTLGDLEVGSIKKGKLIETGKYGFGLFLDVGLKFKEKVDALLPLYTLRAQLAKNEKLSLRQLIYAYGLLDNYTLEVKIDSIDRLNRKIQVSLSDTQISRFRNWIKSGLDRLIVAGVTKHRLKKTIIQTGHFRDVAAIERMGLLEVIVICKRGTQARGILAEIGGLLKNAQIQLFIPETVRKYLI